MSALLHTEVREGLFSYLTQPLSLGSNRGKGSLMQASLKENSMNQRKLAFSIVLGTMLALGLLAGLSLSSNPVMALSEISEEATAIDTLGFHTTLQAQDNISAARVVVVLSGEKAAVRSITWTGTISRVTALRIAGFDVENLGDAICSIEGDGCPPEDCFCSDNQWWQGRWETSEWDSSGWPPANLVDGDVIGFHQGDVWSPPAFPAQSYVGGARALDWLRDQQQSDGSFGSLNSTAEALIAAGANQVNADTWHNDGPSLLANMLSEGPELANRNASGVGKLAVALASQESCWPVEAMTPLDYYDPVSGTFALDTLYQAWGMLGTSALSGTVPPSATQHLKELQQPDGGWEWAVGQGTDTNSTALALQALIAAGEPATSSVITSGLSYLENAQNGDGGFPYSPDSPWGTASDANSTAYVVQTLLATKEDPLTGTWAISSTNPVSYLLGLQLPDGSFEWQEGSGADLFATRQAIPALLHQPFPLKAASLQDCYGISGKVSQSQQTNQSAAIQETGDGIAGVTVWAQGASDLYFGSTIGPAGAYTISVPSTGTYALSPSYGDYVFSPTERAVQVTGGPGDVTSGHDFVGEMIIYLPLIMRR
jgi:hypothetical protein